jgi:hypothetical protein
VRIRRREALSERLISSAFFARCQSFSKRFDPASPARYRVSVF